MVLERPHCGSPAPLRLLAPQARVGVLEMSWMNCWSSANNSFFHTLKFLLFSALAPSSSSVHTSKSKTSRTPTITTLLQTEYRKVTIPGGGAADTAAREADEFMWTAWREVEQEDY